MRNILLLVAIFIGSGFCATTYVSFRYMFYSCRPETCQYNNYNACDANMYSCSNLTDAFNDYSTFENTFQPYVPIGNVITKITVMGEGLFGCNSDAHIQIAINNYIIVDKIISGHCDCDVVNKNQFTFDWYANGTCLPYNYEYHGLNKFHINVPDGLICLYGTHMVIDYEPNNGSFCGPTLEVCNVPGGCNNGICYIDNGVSSCGCDTLYYGTNCQCHEQDSLDNTKTIYFDTESSGLNSVGEMILHFDTALKYYDADINFANNDNNTNCDYSSLGIKINQNINDESCMNHIVVIIPWPNNTPPCIFERSEDLNNVIYSTKMHITSQSDLFNTLPIVLKYPKDVSIDFGGSIGVYANIDVDAYITNSILNYVAPYGPGTINIQLLIETQDSFKLVEPVFIADTSGVVIRLDNTTSDSIECSVGICSHHWNIVIVPLLSNCYFENNFGINFDVECTDGTKDCGLNETNNAISVYITISSTDYCPRICEDIEPYGIFVPCVDNQYLFDIGDTICLKTAISSHLRQITETSIARIVVHQNDTIHVLYNNGIATIDGNTTKLTVLNTNILDRQNNFSLVLSPNIFVSGSNQEIFNFVVTINYKYNNTNSNVNSYPSGTYQMETSINIGPVHSTTNDVTSNGTGLYPLFLLYVFIIGHVINLY